MSLIIERHGTDFIVVEEIVLTEFQFLNLQGFHQLHSNDIQTREDPTTTRSLLIRHRATFDEELQANEKRSGENPSFNRWT
jgi:predicted HAD superfamily Cof-like phosphohydrolase